MAQRLLIKWKYRSYQWQGTVKGDTEPTLFVNGSLCVTDLRAQRKNTSKEWIPADTYSITSVEDGKMLAEDLVLGVNMEIHEANRLAWLAKEAKTARVIEDAQAFLDKLKKG